MYGKKSGEKPAAGILRQAFLRFFRKKIRRKGDFGTRGEAKGKQTLYVDEMQYRMAKMGNVKFSRRMVL